MASNLADLGFKPDVALISSAARTRETWDAAVEAFPDAVATYRPDPPPIPPELREGFDARIMFARPRATARLWPAIRDRRDLIT